MGQFISKEEEPEAKENLMDVLPIVLLPDEVLLEIMGYLSTKYILKNWAQVSRRFHRLSRDSELFKNIEFKSPEFTYCWMFFSWSWTVERKEKFFNDFFEVLKNAQKLKFLSLQLNQQSIFFGFFGNRFL